MNVRIRFSKYGSMKFIGHLDVMRYFQKAVRRAGLPVAYSQGFHPHQIMSFASPLGVGVTSDTEFMDLELKEFVPAKDVAKRLDAAMTDGFAITGCRALPEPENGRKRETAMSLITCADYLVSLKDGYAFGENTDRKAFFEQFSAFLAQDKILVTKEVKKSGSEKEMDLKQFLFAAGTSVEAFWQEHPVTKNYYETTDTNFLPPVFHADRYENGVTLVLRLSAGSAVNIKPELVVEAFCKFAGVPYEPFAWQIHRFGMYTGENPEFAALI